MSRATRIYRCRECRRLLAAGATCPSHPEAGEDMQELSGSRRLPDEDWKPKEAK